MTRPTRPTRPTRATRATRKTGFTLIEVLLALTLLGIGLVSLAAMQLVAFDHSNRGRHLTQAATEAERRMEELMRQRWTNLIPTGGWSAPTTVSNVVQTQAGSVVEQTYEVTERIADLVPGRTRSIDVLVQWNEPSRPNRRYALSNVRFNYEGL